jgi:TatD DNase family protein
MLIDSHAHLDDPRFDTDRDAVLQRAWDAGVRRILTIRNGRGPDDMGCGIPIAAAHDWVWTSVGIHPHDAAKAEPRHFDQMEQLASNPRVIAIGETGLDYHYDNSPRDVQREVFRQQLRVAKKLDLPVIVHTREADEDTERILREEGPPRGIIHCFTSGPGLAEVAIELGFHISFSGIVTFPKADNLSKIAQSVPEDRLLVRCRIFRRYQIASERTIVCADATRFMWRFAMSAKPIWRQRPYFERLGENAVKRGSEGSWTHQRFTVGGAELALIEEGWLHAIRDRSDQRHRPIPLAPAEKARQYCCC